MTAIRKMNEMTCNDLGKEEGPWVRELRNKAYRIYESNPIPKWKRVKLKNFQVPLYRDYEHGYMKKEDHGEIYLEETMLALSYKKEVKDLINLQRDFGLGEKFTSMVEAFFNAGAILHVPKNIQSKEPVRLDYRMNEENPLLLDYNIVIAEENSRVTVVMDYSSDLQQTGLLHNGITKVIAKAGAEVNIVKIQRLSDTSHHFDGNVAVVQRDAKVNWYTLEVGSSISVTDFTTNLDYSGGEATVTSLFLGDGNRKLDMSYKMLHRGQHTYSNIQSHGALKDEAYSVFRGVLDIKQGAKKANGNESQTVLLLDKAVRSDAIPVLFCQEDDVKASHAASAGQLEENKIYYLMSRGLSYKEAKKIIIEGSFKPMLDQIPVDDIRRIVEEEITRRLIHA